LCEPHLQWLKHNSEPWTDVVEHWEASRLARTKDMTIWNGNVQLFFTKWPISKHPRGYILVNIFGSNIVISKSSCTEDMYVIIFNNVYRLNLIMLHNSETYSLCTMNGHSFSLKIILYSYAD